MQSLFRGVSDTITGFYRALDLQEEPAESFFAPDGVWMRLGEALTGREAIRAAVSARDASRVSCHLVSNLRAQEISPGRARTDYFVTVYEGLPEVPLRLVCVLNAHDELVRMDGAWKISLKHSRRHLPLQKS